MITLKSVNKYFNKGKKNEIHVINNTSLDFDSTGLVALLGPSGCGKTTLLNTIGGLDDIKSGSIYVNGEKISSKFSSKADKIRNLYIGYIFQDYKLVDNLSVFDNVALVLKMIGIKDKKEIKKRIEYVLDKVGMLRYKSRPCSMLSGGERQRVGIARAIVKDPLVILADEPTGNLDSKNSLEIMNIIKAISREKLVLLVTHERDLAKFYASRIIEISDGSVVKDYENIENDNLDYKVDNNFYLKDFKNYDNLKKNNIDINVYSDDNSNMSALIIDVSTNNKKNYITNDKFDSNAFIPMISIKFKVKDNNLKNTIINVNGSETEDGSFKYTILEDGTKYNEACSDISNTLKIVKPVNPSINGIFINGKLIDNFSSEVYSYDIKLDSKIAKITASSDSGLSISGEDEYELSNGDNKYVISVTNVLGEKKEYTININYDATDKSCDIKKLYIENYNINFVPDITDYNIKIKDEYSLNIMVTLLNSDSHYMIKGNQNLKNNSDIVIEVKSSTKTKKYNIHITKDEVVEVVTKKNYTKTIIIIVSCLLLVFASITLYFLIKKQKKLDSEEDSVNEEAKLENNNNELNKESD